MSSANDKPGAVALFSHGEAIACGQRNCTGCTSMVRSLRCSTEWMASYGTPAANWALQASLMAKCGASPFVRWIKHEAVLYDTPCLIEDRAMDKPAHIAKEENVGSMFNSWLREKSIYEEVSAAARKRVIARHKNNPPHITKGTVDEKVTDR